MFLHNVVNTAFALLDRKSKTKMTAVNNFVHTFNFYQRLLRKRVVHSDPAPPQSLETDPVLCEYHVNALKIDEYGENEWQAL